MILTSTKISYAAQELSNNESSTDAEMILDIAQNLGAPIHKVSKLVKDKRTYFLNNILFDHEYTKIIRKYLK